MSSANGTISGTNTNLVIPRRPTPLYPDVPWWAVLITALVFSLGGIGIGAYFGLAGLKSASGSVSGAALIIDTISYIPHIILLFGVLADMFSLQGVWSIPSLVGLLSIFANYVFEYFWKGIDELVATAKAVGTKATGSASPPPVGGKNSKGGAVVFQNTYDGCSIQGLKEWNTPYAPQTLVVTATVFSYYCFDLIRNRGWINSLGAVLSFIIFYVAEVGIIDLNTSSVGCTTTGQTVQFSAISQGLRAFFEGLLFGGVSYAIVQTYAPTRLPSSTISPFPRKSVDDLTAGPDGKMYDTDGNAWVVLPNGQAVPDLSNPASKAVFGGMASEGAGTNAPALGSGCAPVGSSCPNANRG